MAITLEQAKLNTQDDYDAAVIDEFRKSSVILDNLIFDTAVNPAGSGATLTYSYRRVATQRSAQFRELNTECKPASATTTKHSVDLKVLGGSTEYKSPAPHGPGDFFLFVGDLRPERPSLCGAYRLVPRHRLAPREGNQTISSILKTVPNMTWGNVEATARPSSGTRRGARRSRSR